MGWPGDWVDYARDAVASATNEARRVADQALKDAANGTDNLGSYKYLNPLTANVALYGDIQRGQENKAKDEQATKDAQAAYDESLKNIGSIADYQSLISKDFNENKDKYTGLLQDADKRTIRNQLNDSLTGAKNNFNSRGLLNSGIEKFKESGLNAKAAGDIQNSDYQNAQIIDNQARDFQNQALKTRTAAQGGQVAGDISSYQQALSNMQAANAGYDALGQAGGQLAGSYLAKKNAQAAS